MKKIVFEKNIFRQLANCTSGFAFSLKIQRTFCNRRALALAPPHRPGVQPSTRSPAGFGTGRGRQRRVFCARPLHPASLYRAGGARMAHPGVHQWRHDGGRQPDNARPSPHPPITIARRHFVSRCSGLLNTRTEVTACVMSLARAAGEHCCCAARTGESDRQNYIKLAGRVTMRGPRGCIQQESGLI